jgi:hypothetical protein
MAQLQNMTSVFEVSIAVNAVFTVLLSKFRGLRYDISDEAVNLLQNKLKETTTHVLLIKNTLEILL